MGNRNRTNHTGCLVRFDDAREGDVVVCIHRDKWIALDPTTKETLTPHGVINAIDKGREYRIAGVAWREEATFCGKYWMEFRFIGSMFVVAVTLEVLAAIVGTWDKVESRKLQGLSVILLLSFHSLFRSASYPVVRGQ